MESHQMRHTNFSPSILNTRSPSGGRNGRSGSGGGGGSGVCFEPSVRGDHLWTFCHDQKPSCPEQEEIHPGLLRRWASWESWTPSCACACPGAILPLSRGGWFAGPMTHTSPPFGRNPHLPSQRKGVPQENAAGSPKLSPSQLLATQEPGGRGRAGKRHTHC